MQESETELIQLIYTSGAAVPFDADSLHELLEKARRNNSALEVTGMLLYVDGSFFQILEGEEGAVDQLYAKINLDPRHAGAKTLIKEPIEKRSFGSWTMGYSEVAASDLATIPGLNDFFESGSCVHQIDPGRARKLLGAFQEGRWRVTLDDRDQHRAA